MYSCPRAPDDDDGDDAESSQAVLRRQKASIATGGGRGPPYGPSATEDGRREGSKRTSTLLHQSPKQPINQFLLFQEGHKTPLELRWRFDRLR